MRRGAARCGRRTCDRGVAAWRGGAWRDVAAHAWRGVASWPWGAPGVGATFFGAASARCAVDIKPLVSHELCTAAGTRM
eukprot:2696295-Prymnesium_polylepis.1